MQLKLVVLGLLTLLYFASEQLSKPISKLPYLKSQKLMRLTRTKKILKMILLNWKKSETEMPK